MRLSCYRQLTSSQNCQSSLRIHNYIENDEIHDQERRMKNWRSFVKQITVATNSFKSNKPIDLGFAIELEVRNIDFLWVKKMGLRRTNKTNQGFSGHIWEAPLRHPNIRKAVYHKITTVHNRRWIKDIPHGACFATVTAISIPQACCFRWHSLRSCTPSDAHTGLRTLGHVGQIHCAVLFTTRQPILYGARQPSVTHGSEKNIIWLTFDTLLIHVKQNYIENSKCKYLEVLLLWVLELELLEQMANRYYNPTINT